MLHCCVVVFTGFRFGSNAIDSVDMHFFILFSPTIAQASTLVLIWPKRGRLNHLSVLKSAVTFSIIFKCYHAKRRFRVVACNLLHEIVNSRKG